MLLTIVKQPQARQIKTCIDAHGLLNKIISREKLNGTPCTRVARQLKQYQKLWRLKRIKTDDAQQY